MPTRPEKVYFFGTCLIDLYYPQAGMAGIALLQCGDSGRLFPGAILLRPAGLQFRVTWHSTCSALREMRVIDYSKSLLRQLKNVELIELQRERCGFGGTFSVKQPELSAAMVADKAADVAQPNALPISGPSKTADLELVLDDERG